MKFLQVNGGFVVFEDSAVYIRAGDNPLDSSREIVCWVREEWEEEDGGFAAIACVEAILLASREGVVAVAKLINLALLETIEDMKGSG